MISAGFRLREESGKGRQTVEELCGVLLMKILINSKIVKMINILKYLISMLTNEKSK